MTPRVVVLGSINVDLFAQVAHHPAPGETVLGTGGHRSPGGKGANQALAARLQGADVRLVGAVGADADAATALGLLRGAGVDLRGVRTIEDAPTGLAIITVSQGGENTIVVVSGANAEVTAADLEAAVSALSPADLVLLQGELRQDATVAALRAAAAAGHRVVLNLAPYGDLPAEVLRAVDPLVVNELEAVAVAEHLGLPGADETATARALVRSGVPSVVLTLGPRGALVADASGARSIPAPSVDAVDTTGAGDAFTGALCARLAAGDDLRASAAHAVRVAAAAVQRPGAQPSYPSSQDPLPS